MALAMFGARTVPDDHPAFVNLPVRRFAVGDAGEQMAVHVAGQLLIGRTPIVCVPGYQRNMSDFTDFIGLFHRMMGEDWPVVLVDLKGRGRSSDRGNKARYVSTIDAGDLAQICAALCMENAIFLGQGYGGQVVMALGALRPTLIAGSILIDSGPISDPRGLVRLRNNLHDLDGNRSPAGLRTMFRRMLGSDYPGIPEGMLDVLATRTHYLDKRNRVCPLFDPHLIKMLEAFEHDDVLVAQWPLFNALSSMPMMMMRTQLTDQLRRDVFEEMMKRRRDADGYVIEGQASPALLSSSEDVEPIAEFARAVMKKRRKAAAEPVSA
jgi:pimeloyl-ACP methyl ester carboxylesterase